ncbi:amidophosphoribosyltransferase isoform 2 [Galdieria sulphuraria]|uniref:Amidophosphoribosyltransferase n=1 Tax=Galdieria sulphuraria TaxID=130081 RepID=M2WV69_GALSU|nr:amidophosphoribosyltransferase isoform 2 [Galdieria sulphuraria]EME27850.1 amidophosphoribosyltransferase isoform 2 [Galdieria sulphuraria]|eukprot:XP_005704370.1 amidophosphoribosyltransferase isoform 2 [Galdieria sulphuraria]
MDGALAFVISPIPLLKRPVKQSKSLHGNSVYIQLYTQRVFFPGVRNKSHIKKISPLNTFAQLDQFHEECGVVGIWGIESASKYAFYGLHALQHRGQEGAGIATVSDGKLHEYKNLGLVTEVFNEDILSELRGSAAIGHNRYSTSGEKNVRNVQPFTVELSGIQVSIAHNGNLTNANKLRRHLELRGSIFNTSSDTEVILHLMATSLLASSSFIGKNSYEPLIQRVSDALSRVEGAYSVLLLSPSCLVAVRDPLGFRPLVMGKMKNRMESIIFASETCVFDLIGAEFVREVDPGEMIVVSKDGLHSFFPFPSQRRKACIFEHIYFARPTSIVFGRSVYMSRFRFGEILAEKAPAEADIVIPVPESGIPAALGYSAASGIPYQPGIMRSHYVGRTFIQPTQDIRDLSVRLKLSAVRSIIANKRLVVVDDSIVRGTTSRKLVRMLRETGAKEVHVRIACPPIIGSCYYGVDTPNTKVVNILLLYMLSLFQGTDFSQYE